MSSNFLLCLQIKSYQKCHFGKCGLSPKKKVHKDMGFKGWWDEGGVSLAIDKLESHYIHTSITDPNFRNYYIFQISEIAQVEIVLALVAGCIIYG